MYPTSAIILIVCLIISTGVLAGFLFHLMDVKDGWKRKYEHAREGRDNWSSHYHKLERVYAKQKQELQMKLSSFKLSKDKNWTIACIKDGHLTAVEGGENDLSTREEAKERATVLARENPTTTFYVIGPSDIVKADIPVIISQYGAE